MAAEDPEKPPADPVLAGIDRIRDTAKWLIGAYAAVGTALIAGLQLTGLGKVEQDERLAVAVVGAAVALLAVLIGIGKVAKVLAPVTVERSDLARCSKVDQMVKATPSLLKGQAPDLATLQDQYGSALADYQTKREAARAEEAKKPEAEQAYKRLMSLHGPLDRLRKMALFEKVQQSFSDAKRWLAGAGVATAAGVIAFAWAANPSDADQAAAKTKESGPTLLEPSRVSLSVDNKRQSLAPLRERLGSACDLAHVPALVVGGSVATPEVVTLPNSRCNAVRLSIGDEIGVALPTEKVKAPPAK